MAESGRILFTLITGLLIYLNVICLADNNFVDDYCWRDYIGVTPKDAIRAGEDRFGRPIYIGHTLHEDALVPGSIHEDKNEIEIEYSNAMTINETIRILCSKHPEKFEWHKTRYDEVIKIKDKHLFEAGYEKDFKSYIGRVKFHGELTVGKVLCSQNFCYKLTTVHKGEWEDHRDFEILTYNPDARATVRPETARHHSRQPNKPTFLTYFFLVLVIGGLVVLIIVLLRRC